MKIVLTESQLNSLVEGTKTVFKDEEKLKHEVETHLSEEKECECECNKDGKDCKCPPDCEKCDCNEKEPKEDWNPNASVATQPGGLMQGSMFPKWIHENKEEILKDFKRFL
tara:strand:+ start:104 stop:436 length:333 start_codon:yes stop_codon:yes gene_type:complete